MYISTSMTTKSGSCVFEPFLSDTCLLVIMRLVTITLIREQNVFDVMDCLLFCKQNL